MSEEVAIAELVEAYAQEIASGLTGFAGNAVHVRALPPAEVTHEQIGDASASAVLARCHAADEAAAPLLLVLAVADAVTIAALRTGLPKDTILEKRAAGLDPEALEALAELIDLLASAFSRKLEERTTFPGLSRKDGLAEIMAPVTDDSAVSPGAYLRFGFVLCLDGFPDGRLDVLASRAFAQRWLGVAPATVDGAAPAEDAASSTLEAPGSGGSQHGGVSVEPEETATGSILLVDPSPDERARADDLEIELAIPVRALDPAERGAISIGAFAEARAIVVAWDLAGRSGLELAESLACDPRTQHVPVLLTASVVTRNMAEAACRAGAVGFLIKPWDAQALAQHLRRPQPAAPA